MTLYEQYASGDSKAKKPFLIEPNPNTLHAEIAQLLGLRVCGDRDVTAAERVIKTYTAHPRFSSSSLSGPASRLLPVEAHPSAQLLKSSLWPAGASELPDPQCLPSIERRRSEFQIVHKGDKPQEGWYAVKRKKRQGCASVSWFLNLTLLRHLTGFHRHLA